MGRHARPTRGGNLLSMRSRKQTERRQFLMESPSPTLEGRKEKAKTQREEKVERRSDTRVPRDREARHTWRRCAREWEPNKGWQLPALEFPASALIMMLAGTYTLGVAPGDSDQPLTPSPRSYHFA
ncbi:hypothetical protein AVEN_105481-1 [Araneus ventricosus]|uniref:Uncharacterized protein n=1 Tax=Araneus ventricosus TaxID=182803 RepID=A0A4Y2GIC0_ARAVE|nr:hypothetical protein AVEN_105481-1 [Araneus ventricosus]